jgi:hypothetical protein
MEKSVDSIESLRVENYERKNHHLVADKARITSLAIDSVSPKGSNALPQYAQMRVTPRVAGWEAFLSVRVSPHSQ